MSLTIGQVLQERYRIDALLAQGEMGAVYRATDETFGTPVAIKEDLEATPEAQEQFRREASALLELDHANLPRITDHFVVPDQGQYLVMDYVEGEDLGQIVDREKAVPEQQALGWTGQVLEALEYLHSQKIIHGDVKPANIRITPEGKVCLVDLGLAYAGDRGQETAQSRGEATSGFASPERCGQGQIDARSDVYSVGATLYALLTGQASPDALDLVADEAQLVPPRQLNPEVTVEVEEAVLQAMQLSAADRFQTVAEFGEALAEPQPVDEPPAAETTPPATEPARSRLAALFSGRYAGLWAVGALLVALIIALVVWQPFAPETVPTESDATATTSLTAEEHFRRGNELIQAGELEKAVDEYKRALEMEPGNVDALTNLGVVYYNLGQLDDAVEQYSKALEVAPDDADIHSNLAAAYVQMNQLDKALEQYLTAVEKNAELAEAHFGLGVVYLQLNEKEKAIEAFERFRELDTGRDPMASSQVEQYLQQLREQ
jgi:serine/threonine-protein kinase